MDKEPQLRLTWHGHETAEFIAKFISDVKEIKIGLPYDYNHALFHALCPDASTAAVEDLDVSGGPELLSKIAKIGGLEEIEELIKVLDDVNAKVQIVSPPMLIISCP